MVVGSLPSPIGRDADELFDALHRGTQARISADLVITITAAKPRPVQLRFARVPSAAVLRPAIAARIPAGSYFDDEHHSARYDRGFFGAKRAATLGLRRLAGGREVTRVPTAIVHQTGRNRRE
jgi:hypothetical protein